MKNDISAIHPQSTCTLQLKSKQGKDGLDFLTYQSGKPSCSLSQLGKMSPKTRAKCEREVFLSRDPPQKNLTWTLVLFFLKKKPLYVIDIYIYMYLLIYSYIYFFIIEKQPGKLCTYHWSTLPTWPSNVQLHYHPKRKITPHSHPKKKHTHIHLTKHSSQKLTRLHRLLIDNYISHLFKDAAITHWCVCCVYVILCQLHFS